MLQTLVYNVGNICRLGPSGKVFPSWNSGSCLGVLDVQAGFILFSFGVVGFWGDLVTSMGL